MRTRYTRRPALVASAVITPEEVLAVGLEELAARALEPVKPAPDPALERLLALARQPLEDEPEPVESFEHRERPRGTGTERALLAVSAAHSDTLAAITSLASR